MIVSIFGAVADNLTVTDMTMGGVYLGGGIAPKILSKLILQNILICVLDHLLL
jgi:glucokinase